MRRVIDAILCLHIHKCIHTYTHTYRAFGVSFFTYIHTYTYVCIHTQIRKSEGNGEEIDVRRFSDAILHLQDLYPNGTGAQAREREFAVYRYT